VGKKEVAGMAYVIIAIVLLAVIVVGSLAAAMMWMVKSRYPKGKALDEPVLDSRLTESSVVGTCATCGQRRIIVKHDDSLCAFCYSSMRTKKM
jgi:hypothetical protein